MTTVVSETDSALSDHVSLRLRKLIVAAVEYCRVM